MFLVGNRSSSAQGSSGDDRMERPEVRSLSLGGVRSVDKDELLASIATSESRCKSMLLFAFCPLSHSRRLWDKAYLDRTELRRDVLRIRVFYWKRGYRDAQVDTTVTQRDGDNVDVTFRITEGPPTLVRSLSLVRPDSVLTDDEMSNLVVLKEHAPFSLVALDSTRARIRIALQDRGYADARIDTASVVDSAARLADVRVIVRPRWLARVGPIQVTGNRNVSESTIRNSLSFRTGDPFKRVELGGSQRRLYESGLFRRASIATTTPRDSVKAIEVNVTEAPPRLTRVSAGFNTFDFVQVDGRFTHNDFLGGARRLDAVVTLGNLFATQLDGSKLGGLIGFHNVTKDVVGEAGEFLAMTYNGSIDFTQPWLLSPHNSAGLGVFGYRRQAPAVFVERGSGASASFTREVVDRLPVSLAYRFELTRVIAGDVYFCVNYGVCDPQTIEALRGRQRLSPLSLTVDVNRRDDPLAPTRGYTADARFEHASAFTGSSYRYNSAYLEGAVYRRVGSRSVLAAHSRVGLVRALASTRLATRTGEELTGDVLHPRTRLYSGGARSVRGVAENQLGPRVLTVPPSKLAVICPELRGGELATCDLSRTDTTGIGLGDRDFTPRPLGGRALLEGSVELRFPVWRNLHAAAFVDGALLGQGSLESAVSGAGAITPGIGIRYYSAVGPIRVDLGLNPTVPEALPVITQVEGPDGLRIVQLRDTWTYSPTRGASGITGVLRRLTLHLSIGEAY